ncbi:MAG: hypothetical protein ACLT3W_07285, partial [Bifidobacterium pseudocatenulatum]
MPFASNASDPCLKAGYSVEQYFMFDCHRRCTWRQLRRQTAAARRVLKRCETLYLLTPQRV